MYLGLGTFKTILKTRVYFFSRTYKFTTLLYKLLRYLEKKTCLGYTFNPAGVDVNSSVAIIISQSIYVPVFRRGRL